MKVVPIKYKEKFIVLCKKHYICLLQKIYS